jgi:NAD/NADP transhydrogenase beta subunit
MMKNEATIINQLFGSISVPEPLLSGFILSQIMCVAMNRSIVGVLLGIKAGASIHSISAKLKA